MSDVDPRKLSRSEVVAIGAGLVAFIALFLPWYGGSFDGLSASVSGFGTTYGWLGGLLVVASGALLGAARAGARLQTGRVGPAILVLGVSLVGLVIVVVRWATLPSGSFAGAGNSVSYGPMVGLFLTLVVAIAQAVATFSLFRSSGEPLPWAGTQAAAAFGARQRQTGVPPATERDAPPEAGA